MITMATAVTVRMRVCDKYAKIRCEKQSDETFKVAIESDCPIIQAYARQITVLTMEDLIDQDKSKVCAPKVRPTDPECLVPAAVFDAAWMEAGMISKNLAKKVKMDSVEYDQD